MTLIKKKMNFEIKKYPDGSSYVKVEELNGNYPTISTFRINTYEDLHHLEQFVDVMNNLGYKPTVTIPNLIDAQADRRFAENQSNGLKIVCKRLNEMNANFRIFHPHNFEVVSALIDKVEIIDNSEFIKEVLNDLHLDFKESGKHTSNIEEHLILMSSDAGGFKPLIKLSDKLNWEGETFSASKSRKYENQKSKLIQQIDRQG
jgi:phosphoribosylpyrophosphate synthetase